MSENKSKGKSGTSIDSVVEVIDFRDEASVVEDLESVAEELTQRIASGELHIERVVKLGDNQVVRGEFAGWSHIVVNDKDGPNGKRVVNAVIIRHKKTKSLVKIIAGYQIMQSMISARKGDEVAIIRHKGFVETKGGFRVAPYDVLVKPADNRTLADGYADQPLVSDIVPTALPPAQKAQA